MLSSIKAIWSSSVTYILGIGALLITGLVFLLKAAYKKSATLARDNSVLRQKEEIRAKQEIEKARIMNSESRRIDDRVKEIKKGDKSNRDKLNSL